MNTPSFSTFILNLLKCEIKEKKRPVFVYRLSLLCYIFWPHTRNKGERGHSWSLYLVPCPHPLSPSPPNTRSTPLPPSTLSSPTLPLNLFIPRLLPYLTRTLEKLMSIYRSFISYLFISVLLSLSLSLSLSHTHSNSPVWTRWKVTLGRI